MKSIFDETVIRNKKIRNRIVMPPMVNFFWSDDSGMISEKHIKHYGERAKGGTGIIIVEATAVNRDGRLRPSQTGIWSDKHIEGLKKITDECHKYGALILLQIHHGGLTAHPEVADHCYGPSIDPENPRSIAMTIEDIHNTTNDFVNAAIRAEKAGFDGVELHGAHLFLLCQFSSSVINRREDEYGGNTLNRLRFAREIINGIRSSTGKDFILSYRMGANVPVLEEGKKVAIELDSSGIDLLHVSHSGHENTPTVPDNFDYNWIAYSGTEIKKLVKTPVITVNEIKTPLRAAFLIENNLSDYVAIGRDLLTDPDWVNKARVGEKIDICLNCKPRCKRYEGYELCPVYISKNNKQ